MNNTDVTELKKKNLNGSTHDFTRRFLVSRTRKEINPKIVFGIPKQ